MEPYDETDTTPVVTRVNLSEAADEFLGPVETILSNYAWEDAKRTSNFNAEAVPQNAVQSNVFRAVPPWPLLGSSPSDHRAW